MWSEEDEEYVGLCTEFLSLNWLAESPEAALEGIRQVVADVVTDMEAAESGISLNHLASTKLEQ